MLAILIMETIKKVSVHGGHTGEFCLHAEDTLKAVIEKYIREKFFWIGITEHCPPLNDKLRYPEEAKAGISAMSLKKKFRKYIAAVNDLKSRYACRIKIFTAFETEAYDGYIDYTRELIKTHRPDYIVGSVHHINNLCFDYSREIYYKTAASLGSLDIMYEKYFDKQYELIINLKPAVVGHFDLIRIFDQEYEKRIRKKSIWKRVVRNLMACRDNSLILDFNTRALKKGAKEPYVSSTVLEKAKKLGVKIVPGDDSHGVKDIGTHIKQGITILDKAGFDTDWPLPEIYSYT